RILPTEKETTPLLILLTENPWVQKWHFKNLKYEITRNNYKK
ncbi:MAG: hypothetical protein ACI9KF_001313, partial [Arenicella sp.]